MPSLAKSFEGKIVMRHILAFWIFLLLCAFYGPASASDGFAPVSQIPHRGGLFVVAPNKAWFLNVSDNDAAIDLWDMQSGTLLRALPGRGKEIAAAAISVDSRYVLIWLKQGERRVFDAKTGSEVRDPGQGAVFAQEQTISGPVNLWFWSIGKVPNPIPPYLHDKQRKVLDDYLATAGNKLVRFVRSDDGKHLLLALGDETKIWDAATDNLLVTIKESDPQFARDTWCRATGVSHFLVDGAYLLWADETHSEAGEPPMRAGVALIETGIPKPMWGAKCVGGFDVVLRAGGRETRFVTMLNPNVLTVWDARTLQPVASFGGANQDIDADGDPGAMSVDGRTIAIPVQDSDRKEAANSRIKRSIWLKDATGIRLLPTSLPFVRGGLRFSPSGNWLVAQGDENEFEVWDIASGKLVTLDASRQRAIKSVSFEYPDFRNQTIVSPNGRYNLRTASKYPTDKSGEILVSTPRGRDIFRLNVGLQAASIKFSDDSRKILAYYRDQISEWDIASGHRNWDAYTDYLNVALIRADGSYRTSAGGKHLLRLVRGFESKALP